MKKGFTLVELSIVLVIIGLLIGGILVAQSMISTSQVEAAAMQIGQFDAGVENFKTKYNYLPGDAPAFGGDGDGIIELTAASGYDNYISAFACESANFWYSIDQLEFPGKSVCAVPGIQANLSGPNKNVPQSKLGKNNSFFIASAIGTGGGVETANVTNKANYYAILAFPQLQAISVGGWYHFAPTTSANSAVKPADLLALDKKIDDGIANTGNVLSGDMTFINASCGCAFMDKVPLATCSSGANYQVQNNSYECTPLIRIGAESGDLQ